MRLSVVAFVAAILSITSPALAQSPATPAKAAPATDSAGLHMQQMIAKLVTEATDDFKHIKGSESGRKEGAVYYHASLRPLAGKPADTGAMLTKEANLVAVGGSIYYMAMYGDEGESATVEYAGGIFKKMADYNADPHITFSVVPQRNEHPAALKTMTLYANGVRIGVFNEYPQAQKAAIIIGVER